MDSILKWAYDPSLQYEVNWLEFLSKSLLLPDTMIWSNLAYFSTSVTVIDQATRSC